jgi:hypothetical protein
MEAGYVEEGTRNLLGAIENVRAFEENQAALDRLHGGAFAFLAFHPAADKHVAEYIAHGSLGDDAGADILALFLVSDPPPRTPREVRPADPLRGVSLTLQAHPAYDLASRFFLDESRPPLPGLVFFDRLVEPTQSIYVLLGGQDRAQITAQCRQAFDAANRAMPAGGGAGARQVDFDRLAARLVEIGMPYRRAGETGVRAAALITGAWLKKNAGALAAAIPKAAGLLAKAKTGGALPPPAL